MIKKIILAYILIFFSVLVYAEDNNKKIKEENNSLDTAYKLLEEMDLKKVYENAVINSTQRLVKSNPKFKKIENKIRNFYEKTIGWKVMKKDLAKLYTKYYTKKELQDITAFYKTQTGKKVLQTMSNLTHEGQIITKNHLLPHMKELKEILSRINKKRKVYNCYEIGYKFGSCVERSRKGLKCRLGTDISIPIQCNNKNETSKGIKDGIASE